MTVMPLEEESDERDDEFEDETSASHEQSETPEQEAQEEQEEDLFKNLADDEELVKKFQKEAGDYFARYKTQRFYIDKKYRIADYMYACAQNRALMSDEKVKGMNLEKDTRANVGSTLFFRQVNQLASQLVNVMQSKEDLWQYEPYNTDDLEISPDIGISRVNAANALARWTRKQSGFDEKIPEFAVMLFKYSNIFVGIRHCREYRQVTTTVQEAGNDGEIIERKVTEQRVTKNHPEFVIPHPDMFYADAYIPDVKSQNCAFFGSLRSRSELWADNEMGYFSSEQYQKILEGKAETWAGANTLSIRFYEGLNREEIRRDYDTGMFMQWECWMRAPIKDGVWDEKKNPYVLYWATFIGNEPASSVCVRLQRNNEPDDEIPWKEVRCQPDNSDSLYHTCNSDIIRSAYSADCTLINLALDNMGLVNDPPLLVKDGEHRIRDFTFRKGQRWHVDTDNAVEQMSVRDNTINTVQLRETIRREAMQALATDPAMLGEFAGARTSATEWSGVNQNTRQPHLLQVRYILHQILPWMAKKLLRYWDVFGLPEQQEQITHMDKQYPVGVKTLGSNYDVKVSIVDEFQDSMLKTQQISQIIQMIVNTPYLQQSPHHTIDPTELLKAYFDSMKWPSSKIVLPANGADADIVATMRINNMLVKGIYERPNPNENLPVHLRVASAERLRWKGLEGDSDPRVQNLPLLDRYIEEVKSLISSSQQQGGAPNGNVAALSQNQSEGEAIGNNIAAMQGAMPQ